MQFLVRIWEADTGVEKVKLEGHTGTVYNVVVGLAGDTIASGSADKTIRLVLSSQFSSSLIAVF